MDPARVVVIGGGIAGLGVALGLGRAGWAVVVLDADDLAPTDGPDRASSLPRRGAPQVHHTHGLLARLTTTPASDFPTCSTPWSRRGASKWISPAGLATSGPATPTCGSCWPGGRRWIGRSGGLRPQNRR